MTHRLRLALVACTALLALALAGQAFGAYNPRLEVVSSGSGTAVGFVQPTDDDATAKIIFYAPPGTTTNLTAAVGSTIGAAAGVVNLAGATPSLAGPVIVADPTNPTIAALSAACTGTSQHGAIWLLRLALNDQTIELPASVDLTTGPEAAFSSAKIQVCFRSPYIPPEQGGQPLGIKPIAAALNVNSVFSYGTTTDSRWTAIFVPYAVGTGTANPLNAAESQAVIQSPLRLRIVGRRVVRTVKRNGRRVKTYWARITGQMNVGGAGRAGTAYTLLAGSRRVAAGRTNANGSFTKLIRLRRTTSFQARTAVPTSQTQLDCVPIIPLAPGLNPRCTGVTNAGFALSSNTVRVRK